MPFILCSVLILVCYSAVGIFLYRRQPSKLCEQADKTLGVTQSRKTTLILCVSTISFYVLYMPAVISHFTNAEKLIMNFTIVLLHISFLINPFLYALLPSFKTAYLKTFHMTVKSRPIDTGGQRNQNSGSVTRF